MRRLSMSVCVLAVFASLLLTAPSAFAAKAIAKITSFKGEVVILTETQFTQVTQSGVAVNEGDKVQTKQGEAEITFWDGSVMKMSPFTTTMVQEKEEESGWWLFKSKGMARRLTVFVGKLGFKSGASQTKNYLQTPTAVCGLRGSEADIGFDNVRNFLNQISGGSDTVGDFVRGVFQNPGIDVATKNQLYNSLVAAQQAYNLAAQTGGALEKANAEMAGLQAIQNAAAALQNNPDPAVANAAKAALAETTVKIEAKQQEINQIPTTTPPTTTGAPTTTAGGPTSSAMGETTSAAAPTTSAAAPTTTTAMMTTTVALSTTSAAVPTITQTTVFRTTTTSRPVSPIGP